MSFLRIIAAADHWRATLPANAGPTDVIHAELRPRKCRDCGTIFTAAGWTDLPAVHRDCTATAPAAADAIELF